MIDLKIDRDNRDLHSLQASKSIDPRILIQLIVQFDFYAFKIETSRIESSTWPETLKKQCKKKRSIDKLPTH